MLSAEEPSAMQCLETSSSFSNHRLFPCSPFVWFAFKATKGFLPMPSCREANCLGCGGAGLELGLLRNWMMMMTEPFYPCAPKLPPSPSPCLSQTFSSRSFLSDCFWTLAVLLAFFSLIVFFLLQTAPSERAVEGYFCWRRLIRVGSTRGLSRSRRKLFLTAYGHCWISQRPALALPLAFRRQTSPCAMQRLLCTDSLAQIDSHNVNERIVIHAELVFSCLINSGGTLKGFALRTNSSSRGIMHLSGRAAFGIELRAASFASGCL